MKRRSPMRHDLQLVSGGGTRDRDDSQAEWTSEGNLVTLTRRSWYGHRPPTLEEVLDPVLPHLDADVRELAEAVVPLFLASSARDWLRRKTDAGLWVSLSKTPWEPVGKLRPLNRMGIPDPEWTVQIRKHENRSFYHLHLPPLVGARPVVAIGQMLGHPTRCQGYRELLTFERSAGSWALKKRQVRAMSRYQRDMPAEAPGHWERVRLERLRKGP
jgi:hypothetical protein